MEYVADKERYGKMQYRYTGKSGLQLPLISLGLWQNFGTDSDEKVRFDICKTAFDNGVTHFDLANNYGPLPGSAETNFGKMLAKEFAPYRDEMIISTKAGYGMWAGPYGDWGSKKYLVASLDQSLKRMGLDYVDIFYHHRPDVNTPLEETAAALDLIVKQGKALYVGISNYNATQTKAMTKILKKQGTPFIIHQARYNMLDRWVENGLTNVLEKEGVGMIAFCPLEQGLLTDRYLNGIPEDSRVNKSGTLRKDTVDRYLIKVKELNEIAMRRGQTMSAFALSWLLDQKAVTSALIGASSVEQLNKNLSCLNNLSFSDDERREIRAILNKE